MNAGVGPGDGKFECCTKLKTEALMQCLDKHGFDALLLAIRRDEHGIRANASSHHETKSSDGITATSRWRCGTNIKLRAEVKARPE